MLPTGFSPRRERVGLRPATRRHARCLNAACAVVGEAASDFVSDPGCVSGAEFARGAATRATCVRIDPDANCVAAPSRWQLPVDTGVSGCVWGQRGRPRSLLRPSFRRPGAAGGPTTTAAPRASWPAPEPGGDASVSRRRPQHGGRWKRGPRLQDVNGPRESIWPTCPRRRLCSVRTLLCVVRFNRRALKEIAEIPRQVGPHGVVSGALG